MLEFLKFDTETILPLREATFEGTTQHPVREAYLYVERPHVVIDRLVRESQHPVREGSEGGAVLAPLRHVALLPRRLPDPRVPVYSLRPLVASPRLGQLRLRLTCGREG